MISQYAYRDRMPTMTECLPWQNANHVVGLGGVVQQLPVVQIMAETRRLHWAVDGKHSLHMNLTSSGWTLKGIVQWLIFAISSMGGKLFTAVYIDRPFSTDLFS